MEAYLQDVYNGFRFYAWRIFYVAMLLSILELLLPASRDSLVSRIRGAINTTAYVLITASFYAIFNKYWASLNAPHLLTIDFSYFTQSSSTLVRYASYIVVPLIMFTTYDFFYYWFHRLQHTSPLMWRFHEVHHSLREMNAWNSYHHWSEEILRIPFVIIPTSILFKFEQGYLPAIIFSVMAFHGVFVHTNTKVNFGILRYFVADNRFHRIHHSIERRHWGRNFGSFSTFWDVIFRTAVMPEKGQWPDVGVEGVPEPKNLRAYLFMPFYRRSEERKEEVGATSSD